ncbi:MAG: hypothetical protein R3Y43_01845 [Alphaproteobacteria bacterium]
MTNSINLNQLLSENVFLVLPDEMHNKDDVKSKVAMLSDGTLVVAEKYKFNACCLTMEVLLKRVVVDVKKIFTTKEVVESIYAEAESVIRYEDFKLGDYSIKKKTSKEILLEKAKKQAKKLVKEQDIPHHQALEVVAKTLWHENLKSLTEISESNAKLFLKKI